MLNLIIYVWAIISSPVTIYTLPEGNLCWSNTRPKNARFCVPAAFTDTEGNIEGTYILNGKSYNSNNKFKVSITNNNFYISKNWKSDNGFQQLILVRNNRFSKFKDSRKCIRRALCKKDNKVFIIESNYKMTLTKFAEICNKYCSDAIYLDIGIYGYGIINNKPLLAWAYFWKNLQTNWLYIE